jgi:hypothetical protein
MGGYVGPGRQNGRWNPRARPKGDCPRWFGSLTTIIVERKTPRLSLPICKKQLFVGVTAGICFLEFDPTRLARVVGAVGGLGCLVLDEGSDDAVG